MSLTIQVKTNQAMIIGVENGQIRKNLTSNFQDLLPTAHSNVPSTRAKTTAPNKLQSNRSSNIILVTLEHSGHSQMSYEPTRQIFLIQIG